MDDEHDHSGRDNGNRKDENDDDVDGDYNDDMHMKNVNVYWHRDGHRDEFKHSKSVMFVHRGFITGDVTTSFVWQEYITCQP